MYPVREKDGPIVGRPVYARRDPMTLGRVVRVVTQADSIWETKVEVEWIGGATEIRSLCALSDARRMSEEKRKVLLRLQADVVRLDWAFARLDSMPAPLRSTE